jgi:hypothetical protein
LQGKGKNRKIDLSEILEIIEDKTAYFNRVVGDKGKSL